MRSTKKEFEIQQQIDERTKHIVALYDLWENLSEQRKQLVSKFAGIDQQKELEEELKKISLKDDEIGKKINALDSELDELYDALRLSQGKGKIEKASDRLTNEQTQLNRKLHAIADKQTASVKKWNENPVEENRKAFEKELELLHKKFAEVLSQLNALS